MKRIGEAWLAASQRIDRLDARLLVQHVAACRHADLIAHPQRPMAAEQWATLDALVRRRRGGEPLAYLLGSAEFYGSEFLVTPAVLVPRPETELLVELAIECIKPWPPLRIADLGTGSGVLAVTFAKIFSGSLVTAVDLSPEAIAVATSNARRHAVAVEFLVGNWYSPLGGVRFDLIVANPPYVADADPHLLRDGLKFEPQMALTDGVGGGDGLACIREIVDGAAQHLLPGGWLLIENGYDQAERVRGLMQHAGFSEVASSLDMSGIERVTLGQLR